MSDRLLEAIADLPDDAAVTVTVRKADLVRAIESRGANPDLVVTTEWCATNLGRSAKWWRDECRAGRVAAHQSEQGSPWYLRAGAARAHLDRHLSDLSSRRRRGPRAERRSA